MTLSSGECLWRSDPCSSRPPAPAVLMSSRLAGVVGRSGERGKMELAGLDIRGEIAKADDETVRSTHIPQRRAARRVSCMAHPDKPDHRKRAGSINPLMRYPSLSVGPIERMLPTTQLKPSPSSPRSSGTTHMSSQPGIHSPRCWKKKESPKRHGICASALRMLKTKPIRGKSSPGSSGARVRLTCACTACARL